MPNAATVENSNFWFVGAALFFAACCGSSSALAQDGANSCPVDGCFVTIEAVETDGDELKLTFDANFEPNMSKNHIHVWWGENYGVKQVSANAEGVYSVEQGVWYPTDDYPTYSTGGVISVAERGDAVTLCVTASDRNHDILDPEIFECRAVSELLP